MFDFYSDRFRDLAQNADRAKVDAADARLNPWLLWRTEGPNQPQVLTVAETAECTCPAYCDRDHVNE